MTLRIGFPGSVADHECRLSLNHLSNGSQVCAGKNLALYIAKGVLATLLADNRFRLHKPSLDATGPLPYLRSL